MQYVCVQLQDNICQAWAAYSPIFPDLSPLQAAQIAGVTALYIATCAVIRKLRSAVS